MMFNHAKIIYNKLATVTILEGAGINKETTMALVTGFPIRSWKSLIKCTNGLSRYSRDLCHAFTILALFEIEKDYYVDFTISDAKDRIFHSLEEQTNIDDIEEALVKIGSILYPQD